MSLVYSRLVKGLFQLMLFGGIISFLGCEKDTSEPFPISESSIEGKWELRTTNHGINGQSEEHPAGNGNGYVFSADNTYKVYENGVLNKAGQYKILVDDSPMTDESITRILFDDEIQKPEDSLIRSIVLQQAELSISIHAFDGGSTTYTRVSSLPAVR